MTDSKSYILEEWKTSMENARHFNDLLIRFRMLGLSMVITLSVAGIAAGGVISEIQLWKWSMPIIASIFAVIGLVTILWHTIQKLVYFHKMKINPKEVDEKKEAPLPLLIFELITWIIFLIPLCWFSISNIYGLINIKETFSFSNVAEYSLTPIALFAAIILLLSLYMMDRFYYYKLLLGAVSRLIVLEKSLEFEITECTSKFIPRNYATMLVSLFYCLPGITLLIIFCISV